MLSELRSVLLLLHLVAMLFMAAPLYMLIMVNERARFSVPPGYNTDRYLENIIKSQPIRCYAYLAVILVTGVLLTWTRGWTFEWTLIAKIVVFAILTSLLSYVHFNIQPRIEQVLAGCKPGEEVSGEQKPVLLRWRIRRKRLSAVCLFLVLTALISGVGLTWGYAPWLMAVFTAAAAVFAWRVYRVPVRLGWF